MKLLPATLAGIALAALASSCVTPTSAASNHWRIESIGPRITYPFFGYDGMKDGTGWQYSKREMSSVGRTLQRRLLNYNPDNPLMGDL